MLVFSSRLKYLFESIQPPTVEDVAAQFDKICDFSENAEAIGSISEATMRIMNALSDMPEGKQ